MSSKASNSEVITAAGKVFGTSEFQEAMHEAVQSARNENHTTTDEKTRRLNESITSAWDQGQSLRLEASKHFSKSEDLSRQASMSQMNSFATNANLTQRALEGVANLPADNAGGGKIGMQTVKYWAVHEPELLQKYINYWQEQQGLINQPSGFKGIEQGQNMQKAYQDNASYQSMRESINKAPAPELKNPRMENQASSIRQEAEVLSSSIDGRKQGLEDKRSEMSRGVNHEAQKAKDTYGHEKQGYEHHHQKMKNKNLARLAIKGEGELIKETAVRTGKDIVEGIKNRVNSFSSTKDSVTADLKSMSGDQARPQGKSQKSFTSSHSVLISSIGSTLEETSVNKGLQTHQQVKPQPSSSLNSSAELSNKNTTNTGNNNALLSSISVDESHNKGQSIKQSGRESNSIIEKLNNPEKEEEESHSLKGELQTKKTIEKE